MTRPVSKVLLLVALSVGALGIYWTPPAQASGTGKAVARGLAKRAMSPGRTLALDRARDARTAARALTRPRTVHRYTSARRAVVERRTGVAAGSHMTSRVTRGRPLSAANAQKRYGLPRRPEVRETIRLTRGQPVRLNRALGGDHGRGELTSPRTVPANQVRRVVRLQAGGW